MNRGDQGGLSDGQRKCLQLVLRLKTSKGIARELGISPHTVDQRLRTAMKVLGASSRAEAAQIYARREGAAYQSFVYQLSDIAVEDGDRALPTATGGDRRPGEAMQEERSIEGGSSRPSSPLELPIEGKGGIRNQLGPWQRLGWIVATAILTLLAFGAFLAGLLALVQLAIERGRF